MGGLITKKELRAVVRCATCGNLTKGDAVPIPEEQIDAGVAEESLCAAVSWLARTRGSELRYPLCGALILQAGSQFFLVFDSEERGTVH